jgi:hypothetical protein
MERIMLTTPVLGVTCLGIIMGWLVRYFIRRLKKFGPFILGMIVAVILGSGYAIKFLGGVSQTIWWYEIVAVFNKEEHAQPPSVQSPRL